MLMCPVKERRAFKKQKAIAYTNNQYFKLLSYEWLAGSPQNALSEPHTAVLTESRAKLIFQMMR